MRIYSISPDRIESSSRLQFSAPVLVVLPLGVLTCCIGLLHGKDAGFSLAGLGLILCLLLWKGLHRSQVKITCSPFTLETQGKRRSPSEEGLELRLTSSSAREIDSAAPVYAVELHNRDGYLATLSSSSIPEEVLTDGLKLQGRWPFVVDGTSLNLGEGFVTRSPLEQQRCPFRVWLPGHDAARGFPCFLLAVFLFVTAVPVMFFSEQVKLGRPVTVMGIVLACSLIAAAALFGLRIVGSVLCFEYTDGNLRLSRISRLTKTHKTLLCVPEKELLGYTCISSLPGTVLHLLIASTRGFSSFSLSPNASEALRELADMEPIEALLSRMCEPTCRENLLPHVSETS